MNPNVTVSTSLPKGVDVVVVGLASINKGDAAAVGVPAELDKAYQKAFGRPVVALAEEINARHGHEAYQPIRLLIRHHEPAEVFELFRAANGCWLATTDIPADKSSYGSFVALADQADRRVRELVESLAATKPAPGTPAQKIADYYAAYLDTAAVDRAGLAAVAPLLASIDAIDSRAQFAAWLGAHQGQVPGFVGLDIDAVLDGGRTPGGKPSTLIDLTAWPPACLREGAVPFADILALIP